jgi:hypothetical protein
VGLLLGGAIEKAQGVYLVLFPYWYAIKPATPFTKMYSVLRCSNFNDIGGTESDKNAHPNIQSKSA